MSGAFRIHRKVLSQDSGRWLYCCWDDCERAGYDNYRVQVNDAAPGYPPKIVKFVFCNERHRQMFIDENPAVRGDAATAGLHGHLRTGNKNM